ncbi:MAG: TIGR03032 family protein [Cyanobacteria bacterium RI_101]|nr:TIGR03032 family protein [Cyanobacteria bacterium RI_101]
MNFSPAPNPNPDQSLRSIHSSTFFEILQQQGISLVVSTYQAGKLIVLRADDGAVNTHFRTFPKPMGVAVQGHDLAVGAAEAIWKLRNNIGAAQRLPPAGKHDACFLPREIRVTGDIDIHEMAWVDEELWFINTRFSCLCALDREHSFVPQWRPPFISAYDLRDRCHLNGLGLRDGRPKYVTALGETDDPGGWRRNKANGGIVMDIESNTILRRGLSMPHSPRWHQNRLWLLESGKGALSYLDPASGELATVAQLPGFTRGLDFYGNLAFVGLSQIRESAVFSGLPLTQTLSERVCGVWIVDIERGETLAFLKFEEGVREIFAVCVLPETRFPEVFAWEPELLAQSYVLPEAALANAVQPAQDWEFAETYFVRGNRLYEDGKWAEAVGAFQKCLELDPTYLPARYGLGLTFGHLGRYGEAARELATVTANEAGHVEAHYHLGLTLLRLGDWPRGWAEWEWRWRTKAFIPFAAPKPLWTGEIIADKTLLIYAESDAGEAIQFLRYLPLVAERCGQIIFVCSPYLQPLLESMAGAVQPRRAEEISLQDFDAHRALTSLPHIFQTTLETIPLSPPYLQAPARTALADFLRERKQGQNLQVGLAWAGSSDSVQNSSLTDFLPLLQTPHCQFYSLQTGDGAAGLESLAPELPLLNLAPRLGDYGDAAAVVDGLDLLITVDSPLAHLAGALGKTVWTLLSDQPHWRWLLEREDSPWYPAMRLFRQSTPGDWPGVIQQVVAALSILALPLP